MPMEGSPVGETAEGVLVLQYQVIRNGKDLPVTIGEACLEILSHAGILPNAVEEIGRAIETTGSQCD